jgi:hypothetical protein
MHLVGYLYEDNGMAPIKIRNSIIRISRQAIYVRRGIKLYTKRTTPKLLHFKDISLPLSDEVVQHFIEKVIRLETNTKERKCSIQYEIITGKND